ncbi:MAG: class I SAM-dependent methyltransferase, partial [Nitrospinae bacterium]|nr:class I SAM-dependent methyltransferase [Nitrospinota bacterium]
YSNVYGVDPNEELIQQIHKNEIFDADMIRLGNSYELPYENKTFDCIYFFNVLHHLPTLELYSKTIDEVDRCIKPGGIVIMIEPNNEIIYSIKRFFARVLSYVSAFFSDMYHMMAAEKKDITFFFQNHNFIKQKYRELGYVALRNERALHQWTFVVKKEKQ